MKKYLLLLCAALLLCVALAGCSTAPADKAETQAVALVIRNSGNVCAPNFSARLVQNAVRSAMDSEGYLTVVSVDGTPEVVASGSLELDRRYREGDAALLEDDARARLRGLFADLAAVRADSPEADTLEALRIAVRDLSNASGEASRTIIVIDSGLSTSGILSFVNNLLSADPAALVEMLREREAIPDFTGILVIWQQLGDVAYPQQTLTPSQRNRLAEIWRGVVEAGGGTFQLSDALPGQAVAAETLPAVSQVALPAQEAIVFTPTAETMRFQTPVILDESQIQFLGDSAEYADPARAGETLSPIADYMLAHEDVKLLLAGTTAGDVQNDYTLRLSQERANAVKMTLASRGVPESRFVTIGLGSEDPWHIYGVGTAGPLASQNRKVVLLDAGTDDAARLIGQAWK